MAQVTPFVDTPDSSDLSGICAEVAGLFERAGKASRTIQNEPAPVPELPNEPAAISFAVAQYLDLPLDERQGLVSSASAAARLRTLRDLLKRMIGTLESRAEVHAGARRNGHGPHSPAP
jgi:hypothetical protein